MRVLAAAALATLLALPGAAAAAVQRPDLTGVWGAPAPAPRTPQAPLPLRPEAKARVDAYQAIVSPTGDGPGAHCVGAGMPASMTGSGMAYPMEILQRPEQINITYEAYNEVRRIYFGARGIPEADRLPDRNGYSSGRWEGDVLVVETTHLKEQIDQRLAHSAGARIVERYRLTSATPGQRVLAVEMTLTDPAFYTAPVTVRKTWTEEPNGHLLPYDCAEAAWNLHLETLQADAAKGAKP